MEPKLSKQDKLMFYRYLDNAAVYFEYGAGGSTYQAHRRNTIRKIYSVENDFSWIEKLKPLVSTGKVTFLYNEMDIQKDNFGHPGPNSTDLQKIAYSNQLTTLDTAEQKDIDLLLIDGRFRVACCLKCYDLIKPECFVAFDDFLNRPYYHIVLDYFNIVDKTTDERMVILQKKSMLTIPKELIQTYELISD
jgi:hypothetical protein